MTRGLQTKRLSLYDQKGSKMNNFVHFSIFLRGHAHGPTNMTRGLQTKVLKFLWQKMALKCAILNLFS